MVYVQISLFIVYLFCTLSMFKKYLFLRDIILFFVALYGLQLIGAIADPYRFYTIRFTTILLFNLQIIFLIIGASVSVSSGNRPKVYELSSIFNIKVNKTILFVQTGLLALTYFRYKRMSDFLLTVAMSNEARAHYFDDFYSSYTELFLNQVGDSFVYISYFLTFGLLFFNKKRLNGKELYVVLSTIAIIVLNTLTSFGRGVIFQLLIVFILFFLLNRVFDRNIFKKRVLPIALIFTALVAIVLVITTMVRMNISEAVDVEGQGDDVFLKPFITYFYVPICAFEYGSDRIFYDLIPMLGAADLAAPIDFVLTPLRFFDHSIYSPNMVLGAKMTPSFYFPSGVSWNALFTGASNYYIDFGFFGFILFPFFHGFLFAYIAYRARKRGRWFIVLLFLFVASFTHLTRSGIQSMDIMFLLIWIIFINKTKAIT